MRGPTSSFHTHTHTRYLNKAEMAGNLEEMAVPDLAKLGSKAKAAFTRAVNDLDQKLTNFSQCLTSPRFEEDARQSILTLRERYERSVSIYEEIQSKVGEAVWDGTYKPKMDEVETKKKEAETKQAKIFADAIKAAEDHEMRLNESFLAPRAGADAAAASASGGKWKLESSFAPKKELTVDMTMQEVGIWRQSWEAYRDVSRLHLAPFPVQRAAFLQCVSVDLQTKLDFSHTHDIDACIDMIMSDFKRRNPRMVLRHQWLKIKQRKDEGWADFQAREKTMRRHADVHDMTPQQLVAHVLMAACSNEELLKKLLEIKEAELTEAKIKEVAEKFEIMVSTASGLSQKEQRAHQVKTKTKDKDMSKVTCWVCRQPGHFSTDCKIPKKSLSCCWCQTKGFHNSNDFCKNKQAEKEKAGKVEKETDKGEQGKADKVRARDKSPAGNGDDGDVHQVLASDADASDDDEQSFFAKQCTAEECEEHFCSTDLKMAPTPTVDIKLANGPCLRNAATSEACPDTGASCNIISEKEARRMRLKWKQSRVTLRNASGAKMRVSGEATVYAALRNGKTKHIRVIVSPDLDDTMLIGWQTQQVLGMLPKSWPQVMPSERCKKVSHKNEGDFPVDKKYPKVRALLEEFEDVFHDALDEEDRLCEGMLDLKLKPGVEPFQTNRVQRVNFHEMAGCMKALDEHIKGGLLVEHDDEKHGPLEWLFYGQFVEKTNKEGSYRIVGDFAELNSRIIKDVYHFPTPDDLWRKVKEESELYFVCDATSSYNQIRNSESTMKMMAVALPTPDGTKYFHFTTAGMGCSNSGPAWCRASDKVLEKVDCEKGVDDCLVMGKSEDEMLPRLRLFLEAAREGNMKFSRKKIQMGSTVEFCGYLITKDGMKPSPRKVAAVLAYPEPLDESSMKTFLGMTVQFSKFFPDLSHVCKPLRERLKKEIVYEFGPVERKHFNLIKEAMSAKMNLVSYSPERFTRIYHDSCDTGLAYMLCQRHDEEECWCKLDDSKCFCRFRVLWCNSRALKPSFKGLPALYLEAIGHHWSITDAQYYLKGARDKFEAVTDHFALVGLTKKPLADLPPKLKELFMELRGYNYFTSHIAGARNLVSDALSRAVHWSPKQEQGEEEETSGIEVAFARQVTTNKQGFLWKDPLMAEMIQQAARDPDYLKLAELVKTRKDKNFVKNKLPSDHPARAYLNVWDRLGYEEDPETKTTLVLLDTTRLCVPRGTDGSGVCDGHLRKRIVKLLHVPHMGEVKAGKAAEKRYFWPSMWNQVTQECRDCDTCVLNQQSQPAEPPTVEEDLAEWPMQKMSADLMHFGGDTWLVMVDWFSNFTFAKKLGRVGGTDKVIKKMKKIFLTFGFVQNLKTDNGPEFRGRFQEWARKAGIVTTYSSAYNSSGNGRCEKAVKDIKRLLQKVKDEGGDWPLALSEWRNCPTASGPSPAQLFYSRQVRSCVLPELYQETEVTNMMLDRRIQERERRFSRVTRHAAPVFRRDEEVWLQDRESGKWDIEAWIRGARPHMKSYIVETSTGGLYLRNRKFIRKRVTKEEEQEEKEEEELLGNEGRQELGTQQRERAEPLPARSYAAVVAGTTHAGPVTRSRARKNAV